MAINIKKEDVALNPKLKAHIDFLVQKHPSHSKVRDSIEDAYLTTESSYASGGKLLIAGNGGSAADSEYIAGELMKRFSRPRPVPADLSQAL